MELKQPINENLEIWNVVAGYPGYEASSTGKIRNTKRIISQYIDSEGYMSVGVKVNGKWKTTKAHRMVLLAFDPNINNLPYVNHKDGNKINNLVSNLEWCTSSYNSLHAFRIGLRLPTRKSEFGKESYRRKRSVKIYVTDNITGVSTEEDGFASFAEKIGVCPSAISLAVIRGNLVKRRFLISKTPIGQ